MRGMIIRGQWHPIQAVTDHYLCRRCHARIGKPWADPITGELDHDRMVCANEHEIREEGDVISATAILAREVDAIFNRIEVLHNYGYEAEVCEKLYGNKDFEGF